MAEPLEPLIYVVPERLVFRPRSPVTVRLIGLPPSAKPTHIRVDLASLGWERTEWSWQSGATPTTKNGAWSVTFASVDLPDGVYEVSRVGLSFAAPDDTENIDWMEPVRHFPRAFLVISHEVCSWELTPSELRARANVIELSRQRMFQSGIEADPSNPGLARFRALAFVQRSLVTRRMRLRGFEIIPLRVGLRRLEEFDLINRFLIESGIGVGLRLTPDILRGMERDNPVTVVFFPLVRSVSHDLALECVIHHAQTVVDVLSPHRSSYGEIFATLLESLDSHKATYAPGGDSYRGNIMGGFMSGEDPAMLQRHVDAALADGMVRLFVALHREAAAERNLDFAYLRYWNLLEVMAVRRIKGGQAVTDFAGNPLRYGGQQVTTSSAVGRVYEFLKRRLQPSNFGEESFGRGMGMGKLSELCRVWNVYRNATAHYGGFRPNDPTQQRELRGFALALSAYNEVVSSGGDRTWFTDRYFQALCSVARLLVTSEIHSPL